MQRLIVTSLHEKNCIAELLEGSVLAKVPLSTAVSKQRRAAEQQSSHVGRRDRHLRLNGMLPTPTRIANLYTGMRCCKSASFVLTISCMNA
jgi:hypothetical protein